MSKRLSAIKPLSFRNMLFHVYNIEINDKTLEDIALYLVNILDKAEEEFIISIEFKNNPNSLRFYENIAWYFYTSSLLSTYIRDKTFIVNFPKLFGIDVSKRITNYDAVFYYHCDNHKLEGALDIKQYEIEYYNIAKFSHSYVPDCEIRKYSKVALGGSFDHIHVGHNLLLTTAILACRDELLVGLTSDSIIMEKDKEYITQSYLQRIVNISHIVNLIGFDKKLTVYSN
jgi:hypothetical protein